MTDKDLISKAMSLLVKRRYDNETPETRIKNAKRANLARQKKMKIGKYKPKDLSTG
jgi:hypothetical protein